MVDKIKTAFQALVLIVIALAWLSRRFPHARWLRPFYFELPKLSQEQARRRRRSANIMAGIELIGLGLLLPIGYLLSTVMFFSSIQPAVLAMVLAGSVLCIGGGIVALVRSGRD